MRDGRTRRWNGGGWWIVKGGAIDRKLIDRDGGLKSVDGCRKRGTDGGWSNYRRIRNNWRISERVVTDKGVWGNQGWGGCKEEEKQERIER